MIHNTGRPRGRNLRRRVLQMVGIGAACAMVLSIAVASPTTAFAEPNGDSNCVPIRTPVSLDGAAAEAKHFEIYGELCRPAGSDPSTVQVLLPGGSYNHNYWDISYQPEKYSYVRHMNEAGHTTFNIDRIGTGLSSHPLSTSVSIASNAAVVHQLVQALRAGEIDGKAFEKVVLVGHSLGTLVGMTEASRYKDVDGFIATGIMHGVNLTSAPLFNTFATPAPLDPRFRDRDPGYVTTRPGDRGSPLFYNPGHFDPAIVETDEAEAKDTITATELGLFPVPLVDGTAAGVEAPVLVVAGSADHIFCGQPGGGNCTSAETVAAGEGAAYRNAPVSAFVLPGSGHCINLHTNATEWFAAAESWIAETI